jgi:hypothetical protein
MYSYASSIPKGLYVKSHGRAAIERAYRTRPREPKGLANDTRHGIRSANFSEERKSILLKLQHRNRGNTPLTDTLPVAA